MWVSLAIISAFLLGFYDVFKKKSVVDNAVVPVLLCSTMVSAILFTPLILFSRLHPDSFLSESSLHSVLYVEPISLSLHLLIFCKTMMILLSWLFSYTAVKNLPLTVVGPVNQMRPTLSLLLMLLFFRENLMVNQWVGIGLALVAFYLMDRSGKMEGIRFVHNKYVYMLLASALIIGFTGVYDKFLLSGKNISPVTVQAWYTIYQFLLMIVLSFLLWYPRRKESLFVWRWSIVIMAVFLSFADCIYLMGLRQEAAVMAVIPLILNGVRLMISFLFGVLFFKEKNIKSKIVPLVMIMIAMVFLCVPSAFWTRIYQEIINIL